MISWIRTRNKGFTLIELLVVLTIMTILVAIVIPLIPSCKKYVPGTKVLIKESPAAPETNTLKKLGR